MLLQEILDVDYLPVDWISPNIGTFNFNDHLFGIVLESININLPNRIVKVVNISFGIVIDNTKPINSDNIDRTITNFGKPRTILATVGRACVSTPFLQQHDIIIVGASDQVKNKRFGIYGLAIAEMSRHLPEYKYSYKAHTPNGTILIVESRIELTQSEIDYVGTTFLNK